MTKLEVRLSCLSWTRKRDFIILPFFTLMVLRTKVGTLKRRSTGIIHDYAIPKEYLGIVILRPMV